MNFKILILQFFLLQWKNILLEIRRPIGIIVECFIPIFGSIIVVILRALTAPEQSVCFATFQSNGIQLSAAANTALVASGTTQFCNFTYFYTPTNNQTDSIIANAKGILDNQFTTVEFVPTGSEAELGVLTGERIQAYDLLADSEKPATCATSLGLLGIYRPVIAGVVFNEIEPNIDVAIRLDPNDLNSEVTPPAYTPESPTDNDYIVQGFISLQDAITQSFIMQTFSNLTASYTPSLLPIDTKQFPYFSATFSEYLFNQSVLNPVILIFIFLYSAINITREITYEKETKLRESMLIMGLSKGVNWLSWYVKNILFLAPVVLICTIILKYGLVYQYSDFFALYLLFMLHINTLITFSFMVGAIFSSARLAMIGILSGYIVIFIPYFLILNYFYSLPLYGALLLSLLSNSGYTVGINLLSEYEQKQIGIQWSNINSPVNNFADVTVLHVYLMLLLDSIIYFVLAWYLDEVLPKEYGYRRPFYFPFTPYYWCGKRLNCRRSDSIEIETPKEKMNRSDAFENDPHDIEVGLKIEGLTKHFGKKKVLKGLSLIMYKGQITSLLGHNGAGKSTTISIITGLYPPTSGTAYVDGHDIKTDPEHVRESLGICPQHNVLFDLLSVWEHLHFFIRLKGTWNWGKAIEEVNQTMSAINLVEKKHVFSSNLSGGMKRRLSVGLAFIGGSKTVILDEPTSGLDPEARRTLWDMLEKNKIGRTILMTTHFMEEADVLGDRIAIMARGELKACGTSLFLKTKFGVGYHLNMSLKRNIENPIQIPNRVFDVVKHYVPDGSLEDYISNSIAFILPLNQPKQFIKLFQFLEESGPVIGVESFGCSLTTLEEVFTEVSSIKFEERKRNKTDRRKTFMKQITMEQRSAGRSVTPIKELDEAEISIETKEMSINTKETDPILKKEKEESTESGVIEIPSQKRSLFEIRKLPESVTYEDKSMEQIMSNISKCEVSITESENEPECKETNNDPIQQGSQKSESRDEGGDEKKRRYRVGSQRIKTLFLRNRPRLKSVLEKIELSELAPTHQEFKQEHVADFYADITLNTGLKLRFQQIFGVFAKKFIYSIRRYNIVLLQLLVPFLLITFSLLTNYINSTASRTDDLLLSVGNTFTRPDRASVFYMETPETRNTFQNNFTLSSLSDIAQSKGEFLTTSYLNDYLAILNSVPNYTNATQCCNYQYQILDEYCAHLLQSDFDLINNCASINSAFGYTNCPTCLSCTSSSSSNTCPRPPDIIYNPTNPGVFSDTYQGALPIREAFIQEIVLRSGAPNRIDYIETFFAGFTTNQEVPFFQSGECLCCSESVTFTDINEASGVCSNAFTAPSTCNSIGVGRTYQGTLIYPSRVTLWYSNEIDELVAVGLANLHDYQLSHLWQTYNLSGTPPTIRIHNHPLPNEDTTIDIRDVVTEALTITLFIGFSVSFIAGSFVLFTVEERETRSKYLQYVSGLKPSSYWIGSLLWDGLLSIAILTAMFLPFAFFPDTPFTGTSLLLVWLLILSNIICTLPLAYLCSFLFDGALIASGSLTVIHFLLSVLGILLSQSFAADNITLSAGLQYAFAIFPSFSVATGVFNIYANARYLTFCTSFPLTLDLCIDTLQLNVQESLFTFQIPGVLLFIVLPTIIGIISFVLTILVDKFHFNQFLLRFKKQKITEQKTEEIDDDVLEEKERIKYERSKNDAIVIKNLTKIFTSGLFKKTSKLAVNDLSFGLQHGECFGLLGVNGAGKTTTFEMMTGNLAATSGSIRVERLDVRTQLDKVQHKIGYCPQFDALQGYMNAYQQLTLYSRIQGIPEKHIKTAVQNEIDRMHLQVHAKFPNQTYSGGNKRKLSTAVALIGGPPILLLDEPTTGMDPDSRRQLWDVIEAVTKAGRTIVLTTHSMEECEALCTKLAIMVNGEFQCFGDVQHLKTKFGDGYTINLQAKELETSEANTQNITNIKEFISSVFDGSVLTSEHSLALDYHIPGKNHHYSDIFDKMEENKLNLNIASYGVSQTTLEQVFLRFAKHQVFDDRAS